MHNLICPLCGFEFIINEDYSHGECPKCGKAYYYWDYVLDEETCEEYFEGYYWEHIKSRKKIIK